MKRSILAKSVLFAIGLPMLAGCVTRVVYTSPPPAAPPPSTTAVQTPPPSQVPPPQVEVRPAQPDVTFVWVPGRWEWRGHWVWFGGYWGAPPHPGAVWVAGHWQWRRHGYVWMEGRWR
ncbi:MAG: hypothetical protein ACLQSR_12535 [Limisphaerales bacterium]